MRACELRGEKERKIRVMDPFDAELTVFFFVRSV